MTALLKIGPWALLILAAIAAVKLYGDNRANEALALARADSLAWAAERHDSLELQRDTFRDSLALADSSWAAERDSLQVVAQGVARRSRVNLGRLRALLADSAVGIPDTVTIIVERALEGLEAERDVCRAELRTCDERVNLLQVRIQTDSSSIIEKDSLLAAFQFQLEDAIRHRRRTCGIVCWATRAAAAYGILELVRGFAEGAGGS